MPATYDMVRRKALGRSGVMGDRSEGTPSLPVGRKLMARLRVDGETLVVKVNADERPWLLEDFPDAFFLADHYRDHPYVLVHLPAVAQNKLWPLLERAWRMLASRRQIATRAATA